LYKLALHHQIKKKRSFSNNLKHMLFYKKKREYQMNSIHEIKLLLAEGLVMMENIDESLKLAVHKKKLKIKVKESLKL